jgi:hypothetical protein
MALDRLGAYHESGHVAAYLYFGGCGSGGFSFPAAAGHGKGPPDRQVAVRRYSAIGRLPLSFKHASATCAVCSSANLPNTSP